MIKMGHPSLQVDTFWSPPPFLEESPQKSVNYFSGNMKDAKNPYNFVVAQTKATIPTSDEINCAKCHGSTDTFSDIIEAHDEGENTSLMSNKPVLCAGCHGSPALGTVGSGTSGKYLSQAIHGFHSSKGAECYDCHPGKNTQCNRSKAHTGTDGNCTTCHGTMSVIASSIAEKTRIPFVLFFFGSTLRPLSARQ